MKQSIVNCALSTEYFKRGKTAVSQRVLRFLKTGSHEGSYEMVQQDIKDDPHYFFESLGNFHSDLKDGRYQLIVRFYEGTYEYPDECDVEYELKEQLK